MRVKFKSDGALNYKGTMYKKGDELEITDTFFDLHKTRFDPIEGFTIEGEIDEKEVTEEAAEEAIEEVNEEIEAPSNTDGDDASNTVEKAAKRPRRGSTK